MRCSPAWESTALTIAVTFLITACGTPGNPPPDGGNTDLGFDRSQCRQQCMGSAEVMGSSFCGTDRITYDGCQWQCGDVPQGVGVFPEACQADGSPAPNGPPEPADGDRICDWSRGEDGTWTAIECARNLDDDITEMLGSMPARMSPHSAPRGTLPDEVDHRARFGPVRNQGSTMMCTAFSTVAAMEGTAGIFNAMPIRLSEMHLWARYYVPRAQRAVDAARAGVAGDESADTLGWRFNAMLANDWMHNRAMPDADILRMLDDMAQVEVATIDVIARPNNRNPAPEVFRQILADGRDIVTAFYTGARQWGPARVGTDGVIPDYDLDARGGHAVLLVGYRLINGQRYFIIRNSWGPMRGAAGYYFMSEHTFTANLIPSVPSFTVTLAPAANSPLCTMGQVANFDGRCRALCTNGAAADEMGMCPSMDCGQDRAPDAHNVCVRGCTAGTGMTSGVGSYDCTTSGCVWTLAPGTLGCQGTEPCARMCEAPFCEGYANGARFACRGDDL